MEQAHTADLSPDHVAAFRKLLDDAFRGEFSDEDWDNTLGGMHVWVSEGDDVVAHVAVVQRRLVHQGRSMRTGYVEGLAVQADRRRNGYASSVMSRAERLIGAAYELGALSDGSGIEGFYQRRGWQPWQGPTWVMTSSGVERTPDDDDAVLVWPTPTSPQLILDKALTCDWRPGDVW
ncbi:GNAT family N-acetyltransferase [Phytoactinopolyspora alkaliphila]|uniref:GNAT family N-acetyltransferase n=1 Tax=Phytoactinopolyspora alkaliphila TaxID=1783498 RepID=UPI001C20AE74